MTTSTTQAAIADKSQAGRARSTGVACAASSVRTLTAWGGGASSAQLCSSRRSRASMSSGIAISELLRGKRRPHARQTPADQAASGARAASHGSCDLAIGQIVEVAQDESYPLSFGQLPNEPPDLVAVPDGLRHVADLGPILRVAHDELARRHRPDAVQIRVDQATPHIRQRMVRLLYPGPARIEPSQ